MSDLDRTHMSDARYVPSWCLHQSTHSKVWLVFDRERQAFVVLKVLVSGGSRTGSDHGHNGQEVLASLHRSLLSGHGCPLTKQDECQTIDSMVGRSHRSPGRRLHVPIKDHELVIVTSRRGLDGRADVGARLHSLRGRRSALHMNSAAAQKV